MTKFCVYKYADIKLRLSTKLGEKILFFISIWIPGGGGFQYTPGWGNRGCLVLIKASMISKNILGELNF